MAKLGSFGAAMREYAPDAERDTFDFFGETFTVEGVIPSLVLMKICAGMAGELNGVEQDAAVYEALRHALTTGGDKPDRTQWERFSTLAAERKCASDNLVSLALSIMGAQSGKDTAPLPTSAPGSPDTSTPSNSSASDSPGSDRMVPIDELLDGSGS